MKRILKKAGLALVAILAIAMTAMVVAPVFAKPYVVTVTVKDSSGKPVTNCYVKLVHKYTAGSGVETIWDQPNRRGKVSFTISSEWDGPYYENEVIVAPNPTWVDWVDCGSFDLSRQMSARVTVIYPPPT